MLQFSNRFFEDQGLFGQMVWHILRFRGLGGLDGLDGLEKTPVQYSANDGVLGLGWIANPGVWQ